MLSRPGSLFQKGLKTQGRNYSAPVIKESTLPNGLRVVSVDRTSPITSISLFVKAGSRYEARSTSGSSHFLKYFAGQNNSKKSGLRLVRDLEHYGATMRVNFDREFIGYHIVLTTFDALEIQIAAESLRFLLSPLLQEYEVDRIRELVRGDTRTLGDSERLLEAAHFTAFRDQGLGQPLFATEQALDNIDNRHLHRHLTENFRAGNISIVGTGLEHSKLTGVVEKLFANVENSGAFPELDALEPLAAEAATPQTVNWTGGEVREPGPGKAHILLAHKAPGRNSPKEAFANLIASVHLNSLQQEGVCSSEARYIDYTDAGLFTYAGSSPEGTAGITLSTLSSSIKKLGTLSQAELDLAKQAALTQHLHGLTNTNTLARHVLNFGRADSVNEIKAVTLNDVTSVFSRLTDAQAVVVASGDVRGINRM